jgi:hypothetical protein
MILDHIYKKMKVHQKINIQNNRILDPVITQLVFHNLIKKRRIDQLMQVL